MEKQELTMVVRMAAITASEGTDYVITSEDSLLRSVAFLAKIKASLDQVDALRTSLVKPLNDHVKSINAMFKEITDPLTEADKKIRGKVTEWKRNEAIRIFEQKQQAEEARKAAEAVAAAQGEATEEQCQTLAFAPDRPDTPIKRVNTMDGSAQFRKVWKFEITNELEIPRQFLCVDTAKLRVAVKDGIREIPGVRIYEEDQLAVSGA